MTFSGRTQIATQYGKLDSGESSISKNCYAKVESVTGTKNQMVARVSFATDADTLFFKYQFSPSVAEGSQNFIKQAYEHLKTLPEFAGATNV